MNQVIEQLGNPKAAATISAATTGAGLSSIWGWLPSDIGEVAAVVGIILSIVMIYSTILRIRRERLEYRFLVDRERKRIEKARQRVATGQPARRCDDPDIVEILGND